MGITSEDFNKLGQNLGRLYFAGEAIIEEWYGYMQGAFITGQEKGKLIADEILPSERKEKRKKSGATFAARSAPGVFLLFILCSRLWM